MPIAGPSGEPPVQPSARDASPRSLGPQRVTASFLWRHPSHLIALGLGSGLSPWAPGTVGTLWAWLSFLILEPWVSRLGDWGWAGVIVAALLLGQWACTRTAQHLRVADPGAIVWDEVVAFWLVLWLWLPAGLWAQLLAFLLFRYFDAAKPGPVGWADRRFKLKPGEAIGWRQGAGILLDDLVAAACTLLSLALGLRLWQWMVSA